MHSGDAAADVGEQAWRRAVHRHRGLDRDRCRDGHTRWVELVARHHRVVRRQIGRFGGREIDTAGDGLFVTFERPADAIRCAVAATEAVRELWGSRSARA
jgi:class 3 adenylate cyclase